MQILLSNCVKSQSIEMTHEGASFTLDNIERFYLTSCTDLSYNPGRTALTDVKDHPNSDDSDPHSSKDSNSGVPNGSHDSRTGNQPGHGPTTSSNSLASSIRKLLSPWQAHQTQGSIITDKKEFTDTFTRVFESPPERVDHTWMYATAPESNENGSGGDLAMMLNSARVVIICGTILIGILTVGKYI